MLIDWFTVMAQAVNFLILVWVLKRLLYRPILDAMAERRRSVAVELEIAKHARETAESDAKEVRRKLDEVDRTAEALLAEARRDVELWKTEALARIRIEMEERREQWFIALSRERLALSNTVRYRIGEQIVRLSEKILRDLSGEELEARALDGFLSRLALQSSAIQLSGDVSVRTGFHLSQVVLKQLESDIRKKFSECREIIVSEDATLGFGVVMVAGDNKWEWNLASYLDDIEAAIFAELSEAEAG